MPFFEDFDDVALWEVVRIGSWQTMDAGTVIIREADQGDSFYVLIDGEVGVTLLKKQLNVIKPGGCFGEILYFTGRMGRRTTTITALGEVTVMEIKADAPARGNRRLPGRIQQGVHAGAGRSPDPGEPAAGGARLAQQGARARDADHGHRDRTEKVRRGVRQRPSVAAAGEQRHRTRPKKVEKVVRPPRNPVMTNKRNSGVKVPSLLEHRHRHADEITSDRFAGERPHRQRRHQCVHRDAEPPAQPGASAAPIPTAAAPPR